MTDKPPEGYVARSFLPRWRFTDPAGCSIIVTANTLEAAWNGALIVARATDRFGRKLRRFAVSPGDDIHCEAA